MSSAFSYANVISILWKISACNNSFFGPTEMSDESDPDFVQYRAALGLYIEDPWERVKFVFKKNVYGEYHPDAVEAYHAAEIGFLTGAIIGGYIHQKRLIMDIKERSDAKLYSNKMDAYRQMSRESLVGFLNGAFKWGPRLAIFTGGFKLFASCVEAYRNKQGIIEYSVGGAAVGCLLKWNFGIRGMLVGSLVGMVLGSVYGVTCFGLCKLTKRDATEIKYGQYALSKYLNEMAANKIFENKRNELGTPHHSNLEYLDPLNTYKDDKEK